MNVDPRQNDPQYQSPLAGDSQQASQFGMGSQADMPLQQAGAPGTQGAQGTMPGTSAFNPNSIVPGTEVYGNDGKRVGTVKDVYDDSFLVQKGIFFVHDYFIPFSVVTQVAGDHIDLGLSADEAKSQDWARRPGLASGGRGVQADRATDTQQSGLNTQNNVNPSGMGSTVPGDGTATRDPNQGTGPVTPNQAPNSQMAMPTEAGLNSTGTMPTQYDAAQYDQSRTSDTDPRAMGSDINPSRLVPAEQEEGVQPLQGGAAGGAPNSADTMGGGARDAGDLGGNQNDPGGLSGDPYRSTALPADAVGGAQPGQGPAYGNTPSANTPLQQQTPANSSQGRIGSAGATQGATERGMQGTNRPDADTLSGAPQDPRDPDQWDPSQQGMTNP